MGLRRSVPALLAALVLHETEAAACPLCATDTGELVRATIFSNDFWFNGIVSLAPFAVVLVATQMVERLLDRPTSLTPPSERRLDHPDTP
jgi:hypothetical protein